MTRKLVALLLPAATMTAAADSTISDPPPAPDVTAPVPPEQEPSAADVADQPTPGNESGRTDQVDPGDSTARVIGRNALFLPKVATDVVLSPVRGTIWLWDRYQLEDLYYRLFFNADRTIGLYPTVAFETGFGITGITAGARFVDRNMFGEHEHLALEAAIGTSYYYRQLYSASFRSGDRLGKRFYLDLDLGYEQRPRDVFSGIGNGDLVATPAMPVNPLHDDTAVETRYSQNRARVALTADARVWGSLHLRPAVAASAISFGAGADGTSTDMVYDTAGLVGWNGGVDYAYGELEVRWDDRHAVTRYEPHSIWASGSLAALYGGRMHQFDFGGDYWRYGLDLQHFLRLGEGPRVLSFRMHGEGVTGSLEEVPFTELPKLGGPVWLRGYALDRFRDRVAAFASAEYQWDLSAWISAALFVDAGRVFPALDQLALDHSRLGYGFGLELHQGGGFMLEGSIASSIDGGLFLNLAFNPVFDLDQRVRRR